MKFQTKVKKSISLLLSLLMLVSVFTALPFTAGATTTKANSTSVTSDDLAYDIIDDGTLEITGYNGSDTIIIIPPEIDGKLVTQIGWYAFSRCTELIKIILPNTITSIGDGAFWRCENLTSINIPDSVTYIGENAFGTCYALTSITIPDSVSSIGARVFEDCESLTSIIIPDNVTSIGDDAFSGCSSLTSVIIGNKVETIGKFTFAYCESLTSITIPDSVTRIGLGAFEYCESLTAITIPNSVIEIGWLAFEDCTSLIDIEVDENNVTYSSLDGNLYNKNQTELIQYAVGKTDTFFTIPDSVTSIGDSAFSSCASLETVIIPESVTSIDYFVFSDCSSLINIIIPNSVTEIKRYAFSRCTSLVNVIIPNSVTEIDGPIFSNCTSLIDIEVDEENKVYSSLNGNLYNKDKTELILYAIGKTDTSFIVPDSVTYIGESAFEYCETLESIIIPDSVTYIDSNAFSECKSLTSITIPGSVVVIDTDAFAGCTGLANVTIENGVKKIGERAFAYCTGLKSVTISDGVTSTNRTFYGCTGLTNITIPTSITQIGEYTFKDCDSLEHVLYLGSREMWDSIDISNSGNYALTSANIHFDCKFVSTTAPDCTNKGYNLYSCSECEDLVKVSYTNALGHNIVNGVCTRCGRDEPYCIESEHPYADNIDESWTIHKDGAKRIAITFSEETETESGCDFIYIYDMNGDEVGCYSGTELAEKRIVVQGDTIKIRLTSDSSYSCFGFALTEIKEEYNDTEEPTENSSTTATTPSQGTTTTEPTEGTTATEPSSTDPSESTQPTSSQETEKKDISKWIVFGISDKTYTGGKITQNLIMVYKGSEYATFTTSYMNNVNAGTATVVLSGTGKYTGTIVRTFKINKAKQPMTAKAKTKTVKYKNVKKAKQTVKNAITVKKNKGSVTYSKIKSGSSAKLTINKSGKITVKKKTKTGTYKIKVKVTAKGNKNYKSGSKTVTVKIKVK